MAEVRATVKMVEAFMVVIGVVVLVRVGIAEFDVDDSLIVRTDAEVEDAELSETWRRSVLADIIYLDHENHYYLT